MKNVLRKCLTSLVLTLTVGSVQALGVDVNSPPSGAVVPTVAPASINPTEGAVFCTAAINADGTSAQKPAGNHVLSTTKISTGNYEVLFRAPCGNVTAAAGFARFLQVDTLTSGAITTGVSCTTADRAGAANGVFVYCTDNTGAPVDTSFFLFVTR